MAEAAAAPGAEAAEGGEGVNPLEVMDAIKEGELPTEGGSDDAAYAMAEAPAAMDEELRKMAALEVEGMEESGLVSDSDADAITDADLPAPSEASQFLPC